MVMNWQDIALVSAGIIGSVVAVIHGVLVQRYMVRPVGAFLQAERRVAPSTGRLVPLLLHFSTVSWFAGGLALIAAAGWFGPQARLATSLIVGGLYLYGALGNLWGTRGRHPGWMLYTVALILIVLGANG
jgi:hypothetical protein